MDKTAKDRMRRYRNKRRNVTGQSVTTSDDNVTVDVTVYPAIIRAIADPVKRVKLEKIHQSLKAHNVLREVRYGIDGPTFDVVGELLEVTR